MAEQGARQLTPSERSETEPMRVVTDDKYLEKLKCILKNIDYTPENIAEKEGDVESVESVKSKLKQIYQELRQKLESIQQELEVDMETTFDHRKMVEDSNFYLSQEKMLMLKRHIHRMEELREMAKAKCTELRQELTDLWKRTGEDYESSESALSLYPGHSKSTIAALKKEIERCEVKKRKNLKQYILNTRPELDELWERCCYGEDQRWFFRCYHTVNYSEHVALLHEFEVKNLRKYLQEHWKLIQMSKRHEELWNNMMMLEESAHGNGGRKSLQEKERKAIEQELSELEVELLRHAKEQNGRKKGRFLFRGQDLQTIIKDRWDTFHQLKEPEKMATELEKMATEPEKMATEPEKMATEPEKMVTEPEKMATEPEKMATEPEKMATEPEKMATEPEKMATEPEKMATEQKDTTEDAS